MANRPFRDDTGVLDQDAVTWAAGQEWDRKTIVWLLQRDLYKLVRQLGETDAEAEAKIDALFTTFASEWSIYVLTGSDAVVTAIEDDATLAWLDVSISGASIRQRLINRLSI